MLSGRREERVKGENNDATRTSSVIGLFLAVPAGSMVRLLQTAQLERFTSSTRQCWRLGHPLSSSNLTSGLIVEEIGSLSANGEVHR